MVHNVSRNVLRNITGYTQIVDVFVLLLMYKNYQGMNEVRRQTAEHQVWEQEWETAFNIQIKLQHVLTLIICWANSDVSMFVLKSFLPIIP